MLEALDHTILAEDVPNFNVLIPWATGHHAVGSAKSEARDGSSMTTQDIDELACFQAPDEDVERIVRASTHDISWSFDRQACELRRFVGLQHFEIAILDEVECSYCSV